MGSIQVPEGTFTAPAQQVVLDGFLFDMDGTIIDSTKAIEMHWASVGKEIGVDPELILKTSHGRRSIDTLKIYCPEKATIEYASEMEGRLPKLYSKEAEEIPGARSLLQSIIATKTSPWAIVTSGTKPLVDGWLEVLNLPRPAHMITAESVQNGKPDPTCYLMGLDGLGLRDRAANVLVLEDSPAGILAGKAAGCKVLGLVTSHTVEQVVDAGPDWVVKDLTSVRLVGGAEDGRVTLEIVDALESK
ncbi:hypothetical protein MCOR25_001125 [Pyricularia grisea]|uniref:Glycerol-3-phosphate phosphatase-like protein n=1 Tax=Pyricularia grisea TaxID=148305 RepID=A0A6P8ANB4_PYRGI|nr:uncharacterized protein PgNI_11755 [Pyricularia grisea]KAI6381655.1 hypothetical protein MCOR25_001125 [Pyricularia grisea]TLD03532.1 hypothetical protein PgNI_11755 [Pyricularia grisea]